jgi:nucleotide-binding universal stress UspA family protein
MSPHSSRHTAEAPERASPAVDRSSSAGQKNATARNTGAISDANEHFRHFELAGRAVLLATDGSPGASAGARVALELTRKYHAVVHVVSVVDTRKVPFPPALDVALAIDDADGELELHQQHVQNVRTALATATGQVIDWPVRIVLGTPASAIVHEAQRVGAALIIVGLRRHGRIDRALNNETALNVIRNAACPVLGVVAGTMALPGRVLAAMDFSETSLAAVRAARAVMSNGAFLVMAYAPPLAAFLADEGEKFIHDMGVRAAFARVTGELGDDGVTFDHVVLQHELPGTTAEMILEYADDTQSDLIAAGSARHSRVDRWMMGSVSTDLVRDGRHSVLIVPPRGAQRRQPA